MLDHFNLLAPIYDKVIQPKYPERLSSILNLQADPCLLDVGGGTGRITQYFVESCSQVVLADTSYKMLQKSQEKNGLIQINGASESLPFPGDYFDRVLMVDALHHVFDQSRTARELWRVVKPGGMIVVEEPDIQKFSVKLVALAEKITMMRSHFLTAGEIKGLFSPHIQNIQILKEDHFIWVCIKKPLEP